MRYHYCLLLLSLTPMLTPLPSLAGSDIQFSCKQVQGKNGLIPITYIHSKSRTNMGRIPWDEILGGQNPLQRCQQATERLQEAVDKNQLNIITTGTINGQKVICTTDKYNGACQIILFSLEPNENEREILEALKDRLQGRG